MHEAHEFYKAKGATTYGDMIAPRQYSWQCDTHLFRHFFLPDGTEIGYVTVPLLAWPGYVLMTFETPRVWDSQMKAALVQGVLV
jgi:hypothetical protein